MRLRTATALLLFSLMGCRTTMAPSPEVSVPEPSPTPAPTLASTLSQAGLDREALHCTSSRSYSKTLRGEAKHSRQELLELLEPYLEGLTADEEEILSDRLLDHQFWWMVRTLLLEGRMNNLGAIVLKDQFWTDEAGQRHPVIVFRTGLTPEPGKEGSCYQSLLEAGDVRHVINLYDGEISVEDLVDGERAAAESVGGTYVRTSEKDYGHWRDDLRNHVEPSPERDDAMKRLGRLIRDEVLNPEGAPPRGNVLVHCGGGMHRTGMVVGILQKVVNKEPMDVIEAHYRYHVDYQGPDNPGGLEVNNLEVIRDFDPAWLER